MDTPHYSSERNVQMLVALMKFHSVRKVVASPGTTNVNFVGSIQADPYFEVYSSVDERSAAYIACGLAAESGEPVALTCTGATASRNYVSGLTEAYYRKLPILAITATQHVGRVGNACHQVIDRTKSLADIVMESVLADIPATEEDEWACGVAINRALIALRRHGGGPAHINLVTKYSRDFSLQKLPPVKGIRYVDRFEDMPSLEGYKRIAILVGCHTPWDCALVNAVEEFCTAYDAVVLANQAANYRGKYGVDHAFLITMNTYDCGLRDADLVIYIGSVPRYPSGMHRESCEMWRVNPDGQIRDPERMLTKVFAMEEADFFMHYAKAAKEGGLVRALPAGAEGYARQWQRKYAELMAQAPELPLSSAWVAQQTAPRLPEGCVLHIAGANTARAWNFFELPKGVDCFSNDGAMGIDGQVSALIGESLATPGRLHFGVVGDLTFFYDMNCLGNRHIGTNMRLTVVNNGMGTEFRLSGNPAYLFGEEGKTYMAAAGHYGSQSPDLVRHYAQDLGFEYLCARTKNEYLRALEIYLDPAPREHPILLEVFTTDVDENQAVHLMNHVVEGPKHPAKQVAKAVIKKVAGDEGVAAVKKLLRR